MQILIPFISSEKFGYKMANFKPRLAYDALEDLVTLSLKFFSNSTHHYLRASADQLCSLLSSAPLR
jgi:hypothetical protein